MRFCLGRRAKEQEKDVRFVELGEYLCEVRAKQYWRLGNLSRLMNSWRSALPTPGGRLIT